MTTINTGGQNPANDLPKTATRFYAALPTSLSRIWRESSVHSHQLRPRARPSFGSVLARFRRLERRLSGSCTVAPPPAQKGRQKDLLQSFLNKLSQPTFDIRATTIALTRLADRLTGKNANAHNLGQVQHKLTANQLRQLADNFKSFRQLRGTVEAAMARVLADGVTTKTEKRFLNLLQTIAANIDATGKMIQDLSDAKDITVDLKESKSQNSKLGSLGRAFQAAWDAAKTGRDGRACDLIQVEIEAPPSTREVSRGDSLKAEYAAVRQQWRSFKSRGTFDSRETASLLDAALRRAGVKDCRERAYRAINAVDALATPSKQAELLPPLLRAIHVQLRGGADANGALNAAVESILERFPKQPDFDKNFEEEEFPRESQTAVDDTLVPKSNAVAASVRFLWEEDDPAKLRYAIHDLSKTFKDKHRQFLNNPDKWVRHVTRDLIRQGFTPARVEAILARIDSKAFDGELEGHSGLLIAAFRKISNGSEIESAVKIHNDADVFGKILVKCIDWRITNMASDPEFDPYDGIEGMLAGKGFASNNVQIYSFFERHQWIDDCLTIPDDEDEASLWRRTDVKKMKEVKERLRDLAEDFEEISNPLWTISREMIGFKLAVTPLDTNQQMDRLLQIYSSYAEMRKPGDPELTALQALGLYFHRYGRGAESLVEQAAELPRLAGQPAAARPHADSGWQNQDDAVDTLADAMSELPETPRPKR